MLIALVGWAVIGLIVGFVASKAVDLRGDDPRLGIGLSVGAAVVGGILYSVISGGGARLLSVGGITSAILAAVAAMVSWHFARTRGSYKTPTSRRSH